jgi:hypothetical protein
MPHNLTRRELFDLVWSKPVTKVAADLGISDVAVKKICDKHRIPVPGRGYWAKIAAGQQPRPATYREISSDPLLNRIHITGSPLNALPQEVLAARERAQQATQAPSPPVQEQDTTDTAILHPLATRHDAALRSAKVGSDQMIRIGKTNLLHCMLALGSIGRVVTFVDRLAREVDQRGIRLDPGENHLVAIAEGETIMITLSEGTDKVKHEPTEAEIDALETWNVKAERARKRGDFLSGFDRPKIPEFEWVPNGRLSLLIDQSGYHSDGIRRKFADGSRQKLEAMVPDIAVGLITCAAARKVEREATERRQREWAEEAARRQELERRRNLESKRVEFLKLQMGVAEGARAVEAFVADYIARYGDDPEAPSSRAFIRWAQDYAARLRSTIEPARLEQVLAKHKLMDDSTTIESWVHFDR